jgi:hypothetical protein
LGLLDKSAKGVVDLAKRANDRGKVCAKMPSPKGVSREKFDRCVAEVEEKGTVRNPYAVCTRALREAHAKGRKAQRKRARRKK